MPPIKRKASQELTRDLEVDDATLDDDEPTTEELVEKLRLALHQANTGQTRPAKEVIHEIREMLAADDDTSRHH